MDKNLANYLFHNETLYAFKEEVDAGSEKTEVGGLKTEDGGPRTDDRSVDSRVDNPVRKSPITSPPSNQPTQPAVYPMKTKHLVVIKNMQPAEKELLEKIMTAIKLSMEIVDLVDVQQYPTIDFKETIYGNMPKAILFFGPESGEEFLVRLKLEKYNPKVLKGINFLVADSLATILQNQNNEKRMLWESLKAVFAV